MKTTTRAINGKEYAVIIAEDEKSIQRIHDNFLMGDEVVLGVDYSTGKPREDKPEYYTEIDKVYPDEGTEKTE